MKPVIAITPEAITLKSRQDGRGAFCGVSYSQAIELAGGAPVILPLTSDRQVLDHFLDTCDGLMLTGFAFQREVPLQRIGIAEFVRKDIPQALRARNIGSQRSRCGGWDAGLL